jgi:hypothetical protein
MALLYHWRKESYLYNMTKIDFHEDKICLTSNSNRWRDAEHGEWCFAFSRREDGVYVLVVTYQIDEVETDDDELTGKHIAYAIDDTFTMYDPSLGEDIEPLIRSFPISLKNPLLGRNFQGLAAVKSIAIKGECALHRFADKQPVLE